MARAWTPEEQAALDRAKLIVGEREQQRSTSDIIRQAREDSSDTTTDTPQDSVRVRSMSTVEAKAVSWLWKGMIPRSTITLVTGDPGLGKSQMLLDIASRVTRGAAWPDGLQGTGESRNVLLLSAEDPAAEVLRPRLEAADADLSRILQIEVGVRGIDGTEHHISLENDIKGIEAALVEHAPSLIIIDPINAYMGKSDGFKDPVVRSVLAPLATLAAKYEVAIIGLMHLNKDTGKKALHRSMGSVAFTAAARAVFMVSPDPDNQRVILTSVKANLSKMPSGLAFTIEGVEVGPKRIETSRVVWQEGVTVTINSDVAMNLSTTKENKSQSKVEAAAEWLENVLAAGPLPATKVTTMAQRQGITEGTLKRAKRAASVASKPDADTGCWIWSLTPDDM